MARTTPRSTPALPLPSAAELDILAVVWRLGPSTVRDVHDALDKPSGYTTTLKQMQLMTEKGLLIRTERFRSHVYEAGIPKQQTQQQIAADLLTRAFEGSAKGLVLGALSARPASASDLNEIRQLLDTLEKQKGIPMTSLQTLSTNAWVQHLGWTLIQFLWQGTVLSLIYALTSVVLRRRAGPETRYVLACLTLGLMVIAPAVTFALRVREAHESTWHLWTPDVWRVALPWIVALWVSGVVVFSTRLIGGWRVTVRLRTVGVRTPGPTWQRRLERLVVRMRVSRPVTLLVSTMVDVPTVVGWWRPVILIPIAALTMLPLAHVESLLAHELAHVRRYDYLINVVQRIAEAALFYHPAVWWVSGQIRAERERCCDDLAVAANGDLLTYVRALAELESHRPAHSTHAMAANGDSLLHRIQRLAGLVPPVSHAFPGVGAVAAMSVLWAVGVGAIGISAASSGTAVPPMIDARAAAEVLTAPAPSLASTLFFGPIGPTLVQLPRDTSASTPAPPQRTTRVEGSVVSAGGGAVPRASIQLIGPNGTLTEKGDDDGRFVFAEVPPGQYVLQAAKAGFITDALGAPTPGATAPPITLEAGTPLLNATVKLTPQGVITGQVINQDGDVIVNAKVTVYQSSYVRGRKQMTSLSTAASDDEGNFRLANLAPGRYYVGVSALPAPAASAASEFLATQRGATTLAATRSALDNRLPLPSGTTPVSPADAYAAGFAAGTVAAGGATAKPDKNGLADVPTFFPKHTEIMSASPLDVVPGSRFEHTDVRVRRERVFTIRGRVSANDAVPASVPVIAQRIDSGILTQSAGTVAVDGAFQFVGLAPGTYTLRVPAVAGRGAAGLPSASMSGMVENLVARGDLDGVIIELTPGVTVTGTIKPEGTDTLAAAVNPALAPSRWRMRLVPDAGAGPTAIAVIKDDGTFTTSTPVAPGKYLLDLTLLPEGTYVKSIRSGGQDVGRDPIEIATSGGALDITLSPRGATAGGVVRDGQGRPAAGTTVKLWPRVPARWSSTLGAVSATTDQNGRFEVGKLPPGDYYAAGWEGQPANSGLIGVPELLARFAGEAASVTITEGARAMVNAPRISAAAIATAASRLP